ncbi:hypothetical protein ACWFOP_25600 [Bacillus mycoides]
MKQYSIFKQSLIGYFQIRFPLMISVILIVFSMLFQCFFNPETSDLSILDLISNLNGKTGTANMSMLVFTLIPLFAFVILSLIDNEEIAIKILKRKSRAEIWNKHVVSILYLSLFLTIIIIFLGYIFSGLTLGRFENDWTSTQGIFYKSLEDKNNFHMYINNLSTIKVLSIVFITKFIGLFVIGLMISTFKAIFNKNSIVFIVITMFGYLDGFYFENSMLLRKIALNIENWKSLNSVIANQFYLLTLIMVFYFLGRELYNRKDFYN